MATTPKVPENEAQRLAALKSYRVLDTAPEQAFDDLTLLASEICGTPVALVSLIDEKRQWFKSHHGLDVTETPREIAFCAHAIHQFDALIVEDATQDERFKENPLVQGSPYLRFYAGAPLTTPEGFNIGTLCVVDSAPKKLSENQIRALNALAKRVVAELERKKAFAHLERLKLSLDDAQRLTKHGSWDWDIVEGTILWSDNQYQLYGRDADFVPTFESYLSHYSPQSAEHVRQTIGNVLEGKGKYLLEHEATLPNGEKRIFLEAGQVEFDADGKPIRMYGSTQDITAAKEAEHVIQDQKAKLISASKMSALGEMAGGVAHEINNPLAIINGKVSQLKRLLASDKVDVGHFAVSLDKIENTVFRIAKIIRGLSSFSRNSDHDPMVEVELTQILADTLELCTEKMKNDGIELRLKPIAALTIMCRGPQVSQILMNLLSNAYDATVKLPEKWIEISAEYQEGRVRVMVTDSGSSIPPAVIEKMMQPFFTTKEIGKGTGLGLSLSKGLAEVHGGSLSFDASCKNTRFILELPAHPVLKKDVT